MTRPLYKILATTLDAAFSCERAGNHAWFGKHLLRLELLVKEFMPSGGGFDAGTSLRFELQTPGQLRFGTSFHHMDDAGYYRRWTSHEVVVTPSLSHGFDLRVTGSNLNCIKEYINEAFHFALMEEVDTNAMMEVV